MARKSCWPAGTRGQTPGILLVRIDPLDSRLVCRRTVSDRPEADARAIRATLASASVVLALSSQDANAAVMASASPGR
jgi:hypothetical protein